MDRKTRSELPRPIEFSDRIQAVESDGKYRSFIENLPVLFYAVEPVPPYSPLYVSPAFEKFGYPMEQWTADPQIWMRVIHEDDINRVFDQTTASTESGANVDYEYRIVDAVGKTTWVRDVGCLIRDVDGIIVCREGVILDITDRKMAEEAVKVSEEQYRDLFENANDLIYTHDLNGVFTSLNGAGERITGYNREEAMQLRISEVVAPEYIAVARQMTARKLDGELADSYELEILAKDGRRVMLELSTRLVYSNGKPIAVQGIGRDITSRRYAEDQLRYNSRHDALTNLPNRLEFMEHLQTAVSRAQNEPDYRFGVLFLDLDRFKVINDSLGHVIGDKLLVGIAKRLNCCIRPNDIVARLGGDEFTVLLNKISGPDDATMIAERLQRKLAAPFKFGNYEVFTSASIGIIVSDDISRNAEDFLRDADTAMYRAKDAGKARCEVFDREMHIRNMNLLQVETDLRHAVDRHEFELHYQPIVSLETGSVCEFEALVRWNHPIHGIIDPGDFIGAAEETGLIIPIGRWVLDEACRQIAKWQKQVLFPLAVSVNLSAKQLMHPSLISEIKQTLGRAGLHASQLKLEVTESSVMENSELAMAVLSELNVLGISLSTDDFGTGYSSLSYLQRFPFNRLKIDRSFVDKMDKDAKSEAIVKTILMLGENLGIEVVAEGVETETQFDMLRILGCRLGQGYLFSRPVEAKDASHMLNATFEYFDFTRSIQVQETISLIEASTIQ